MPRFYPLTRGNVNPPLALAKPVARDPSRLRHCHPAGNALVHVYGYFTTDSTNLQGDPNANQPNGYPQSEWVRSGALADAKLSDLEGGATELKSYTYDNTITDGNGNYTYPLASESDYPSGSAVTTNYTNTAYPGSLQLQEVETQLPGVTADQNGPSANGNDHRATSFEWYDENGNAVWDEDALGTYTFNYYDPATGNLLATIQDVDNTGLSAFEKAAGVTAWIPAAVASGLPSTGHLNAETDYQYDSQGRQTLVLGPAHVVVTTNSEPGGTGERG